VAALRKVSALDIAGIRQVVEGLEARPIGEGPSAARRRRGVRRARRHPPGPLMARLEGSRRTHRRAVLRGRFELEMNFHLALAVAVSVVPGPPYRAR
jgi:hypothetical protein